MAVLPLRSTGQVRGLHLSLLLVKSTTDRAKEQTNQVGWERSVATEALTSIRPNSLAGEVPLSAVGHLTALKQQAHSQMAALQRQREGGDILVPIAQSGQSPRLTTSVSHWAEAQKKAG